MKQQRYGAGCRVGSMICSQKSAEPPSIGEYLLKTFA
jgi:hypothetical protein